LTGSRLHLVAIVLLATTQSQSDTCGHDTKGKTIHEVLLWYVRNIRGDAAAIMATAPLTRSMIPILLTLVARTPLLRLLLVVARASILTVLSILVRLCILALLLVVHAARIALLIAHLKSSGRLHAIAVGGCECVTAWPRTLKIDAQ
jgi:hypothetical protein